MNNRAHLIALNHIPSVGPRTIIALLKQWPQLEVLFKESQQALEKAGLSNKLATAISQFDQQLLEKDWQWQAQNKGHILTWDDPEYPLLLKEIHDAPPVLYAKGDLSALTLPTLAMVGSRKPSITGAETAKKFAYELSQVPIAIVSGLALGIDANAHQGCLDAKGTTIAVMGTGIDSIYPRTHYRLADEITEKGLLISEFPLNSRPTARHFPRRNRIISGLSISTLVVEAAIKSGSLITARFAIEQNRDVLAIPGSIHNPLARGCHYLLQQGAMLVTSSQDVIDTLKLPDAIVHSSTTSEASSDNLLVKYIGFETTSLDKVIQRSGLDVETITCELALLEIMGHIQAVPGGYMRCQ